MNRASLVANEMASISLMNAVMNKFKKLSTNNKVYLERKLFNILMEEKTSIIYHINEVTYVINKLASVKITFSEESNATLFFTSVPNNS